MTARTASLEAPATEAGASGVRAKRWSHRFAARYGLTIAEARAELRRLVAYGWQTWELVRLAGEESTK